MPVERWSQASECPRGILRIRDPVPALEYVPTLTYEPLAERLWTISDGTYRTVLAEGDRSAIAFDTFYSPGSATAYRQAVGRLLQHRPIETIVYSHDHLDHTGFGSVLAPGARVIAHEAAARVIEARGADGQLVPTDCWSGERRELVVDGVEMELVYPGATHGNGNVAALFREARVLFMVDTVAPGVGYTFLPDWHVDSYLPSLRRVLDLEWDRFVPGHFWPIGRREFAEAVAWWEALVETAHAAHAAGVEPDDLHAARAIVDERLRPAWGHLFRFEEYAALNLMRFLLHVRTGGWGLEDCGAGE